MALKTLAFNDKIADLTLAYENELRTINGRKDHGLSNARMMQKELVEALNEIEQCVQEGQQQINSEKQRQQQLREQNTQIFRESVETLQREFHERIDRQLEKETRSLRDEETKYDILEQEAIAEQKQALSIATLQCTFPTKIAFQHLPEHSPDHRYIESHFKSSSKRAEYTVDTTRDSIQILQTHRFFHQDLVARFEGMSMPTDATNGRSHSSFADEGTELYLYLVANEDEVTRYLQSGISSSSSGAEVSDEAISDWLFLFSNPLQAISFYRGTPGEIVPDDDDDQSSEEDAERLPRIESFHMLLCRVRMHQTIELFYPEKQHLTSLEALHAVATPKGSVLHPPPAAFLQLELGGSAIIERESASCGHVYMARKAMASTQVLPQFLILCSKRLPIEDAVRGRPSHHSSENGLQGDDGDDTAETCSLSVQSSSAILDKFQQLLQAEVSEHHRRLYHEVDPQHVRFRAQSLDQKQRFDDRLQQQRTQIEHEKRVQEQLIKSMRADRR